MGFRVPYNIVVAFLLLVLSQAVKAQIPGMKIYGQSDGYLGSIGYIISQDSRGYIWLGTDNGAIFFNGKNFVTISDQDGLKEKEIIVAAPTTNNSVLLIPLLNKLAIYKNGKVNTEEHIESLKKIQNKIYNKVLLDEATGDVGIIDADDVDRLYLFNNDSLFEHKIEEAEDKEVVAHLLDNNEVFFSNIEKEFWKYNLITKKWKRLSREITIESNVHFSKTHNNIILVSKDTMRVCGYNGDIVGDKDVVIPIQGVPRFDLADANGNLWRGLRDGGVEFWGDINKIDSNTKPQVILENMLINWVFCDRDGNFWFTTERAGLCFISKKHWNSYLTLKKKNLGTISNAGTISVNQKETVIGHYDNNVVTAVRGGKKRVYSFSNNYSTGVRRSKVYNGKVWLLHNSQVTVFDGGKINKSAFNGPALKDFSILKNKIALAVNNGVYYFDIAELKDIEEEVDEKFLLYNKRTTSIEIISDTLIMFGTPKGMFTISSLNGYKNTVINKIDDRKIADADITELKKISDTTIFVGTSSDGLYLYNFITGDKKKIIFGTGGSPGTIRKIYEYSNKYWLATDHGIWSFKLNEEKQAVYVRSFNFYSGLPSDNVLDLCIYNDTLYAATASGLGVFPIKNNTEEIGFAPQVWVEKAQSIDNIDYFPSKLKYRFSKNSINLSLSTIHYQSLGKTTYVYNIKGLNNNWTTLTGNELSITELPPGNYQLNIFAISTDGEKSRTAFVLPIIITPLFWQTWWSYSVIIVVIILLLGGMIYKRVSFVKKQIQLKTDLKRYRDRALRNQMSPHFIYNSLNSIQNFMLKNDSVTSVSFLSKFSRLMRLTFNNTAEEKVTLDKDLEALQLYVELENLRFSNKIELHVNIDPEIQPTKIQVPPILLQPIVENAILHGLHGKKQKGNIWIDILLEDENTLKFTIKDDGMGREAAAKIKQRKMKYQEKLSSKFKKTHHSGLSTTKARISQVWGGDEELSGFKIVDLYNTSQEPLGTSVVFKLPLSL